MKKKVQTTKIYFLWNKNEKKFLLETNCNKKINFWKIKKPNLIENVFLKTSWKNWIKESEKFIISCTVEIKIFYSKSKGWKFRIFIKNLFFVYNWKVEYFVSQHLQHLKWWTKKSLHWKFIHGRSRAIKLDTVMKAHKVTVPSSVPQVTEEFIFVV